MSQRETTDAALIREGLFAIADALRPLGHLEALAPLVVAVDRLATQVKYLGGGDNGDQRGAVEFLGMQVQEGMRGLAASVDTLADVNRERE